MFKQDLSIWKQKQNKNYNCNGPPAFKSQKVGYQSNEKLLHHYQHLKNHLNS